MYFDNLDSAFSYIESFTNFEKETPQSVRDFKQDRMEKLLRLFRRPDRDLELFHIAGSKGKGSTAVFLSQILKAAGHKTGLYTSPHVRTYRERITLAGEFFADRIYLQCIEKIAEILKSGKVGSLRGDDGDPTTFELLTLLAFLVFQEAECTHAVIETGIGGRLDATNVIHPAACLLTPVELEHTDILGETIEQITFEKAGIIKEGVPVFCGFQSPVPEQIFLKTANEKNAPMVLLEEEIYSRNVQTHRRGTDVQITWTDGRLTTAHLAMLGDFQAENAALAAAAAYKMGIAGAEAIKQGLEQAVLPGRMELIEGNPPILIDGAHTPSSLARLCTSFTAIFDPQKKNSSICIFGCVDGKRTAEMTDILARHFTHIIISTPGSFKKNNPADIYSIMRKKHNSVQFVPLPREALSTAMDLAEGRFPILVTGSFYMAAEISSLV